MGSSGSSARAWRIADGALFAAVVLAAALNMLHIRAGFLTSYLADLVVPAWLYVNVRGLTPETWRSTLLKRTVGHTPERAALERAALTLFIASTLTEISQIYWPHGLFASPS